MNSLDFPETLDRVLLKDIYDDDAEYAYLMFGLFLTEIVPQIYTLRQVAEQQNWPLLRQIAHKIKPTFGMVGVPQMEQFFDKLEAETQLQSARAIINSIDEKLAQVLPVVQTTYAHLKNLQDEN
ncbi:Hpt domain-containing protein [Telluribacter sp.]|jgi:HPt (histidine-containing phosphotransfer) domain-containing protein|uniref:Hpt domain-containing protein n=1 Tax=Telluribacter sp. TaxID=1978767 RepID=UPI002E12047F|nr:Hpt domain-containing protein [Telluribacter sp.]